MKKNKLTALNISTNLVASVFVGGLLGYYSDGFFNTKPMGLIIGLVLGIFSGLSMVYKEMVKDA